ncbi:MAG: WbqC family protein [Candidatus Omnitrophota bacterium]
MIVSVHQPQYIPWLGYFDKIARSDCFVFLDNVQYKEREFQNRNKIRTKDGWVWLTVPVVSKGLGRQKIADVAIDNGFAWRKQHLKSWEVWYARSPFFKENFAFFEKIYTSEWDKLAQLNIYIIQYVLKMLGVEKPVFFESVLQTTTTKTERIIEICRKLKADVYLSGAGGRDYIEADKFREAGIELRYQDFIHPEYRQQFSLSGKDFISHLSIFDLLLNEGPESRKILGL